MNSDATSGFKLRSVFIILFPAVIVCPEALLAVGPEALLAAGVRHSSREHFDGTAAPQACPIRRS